MPLQKQPLTINFSNGLDTKTDPFQVPSGRFLSLQNSVFTKGGLLQKRNGYAPVTTLPTGTEVSFLTTFNGNLTTVGTHLNAFSAGSSQWIDKGSIEPVTLVTLPLIRSSTNQSQADAAVSENNLVCTAYTDNTPSMGSNVQSYKYVIADATTGQNLIEPTVIPGSSNVYGSPRVFILNKHFIIVYSTASALNYIAINIYNLVTPNSFVTISSVYSPATTVAFDGVVANNVLYLAWNGSDMGGAIRMTYLDAQFNLHTDKVITSHQGDIFSLCADVTGASPVIYVSFYDTGSQNGYTFATDPIMTTLLGVTQILSSTAVLNITAVAKNAVMTFFFEVSNTYTYDASIKTNYVKKNTLTRAGVLGSASILLRSVGLASKAFLYNNSIYMMTAYGSSFQPTYFLVDYLSNVIAKLAYSNGGGNVLTGLPSTTLIEDTVNIPYLFKDLIEAVNKSQGAANTAGIYSQTGVNLASFTFAPIKVHSAEIAGTLNISGGFLWTYDGYTPVEQNFHLWPDYVEATPSTSGGGMLAQTYFYQATYEWADNQGNIFRSAPSVPIETTVVTGSAVTFTSVFSAGDTVLTVSSTTGLYPGQIITDSSTSGHILPNTTITAVGTGTITLSQPTQGDSTTIPGDNLQTVMTGSITVNVPTIRLTYKINNPAKIVIYRWSAAQQNYYQVTSVSLPLLNDTSVDYVTFTDTQPDNQIIGNNLIYTTGSVLENIAAPGVDSLTLFQSRLWIIDAEDKNLLWFSKQVIEGTPVEMSDLLTVFVAPTTGAQGSTGPMTALSVLDDKLIIFKKDAIYYINGVGPDNTGANNQFSEPTFLTSVVGCVNQQSIVFQPQGLMFESDKGIWLLGRDLSTNYIGAPVESFTEVATVESAVNVPGTNQVRFTMSSGVTLMYDYYYGQWGTFTNIPAISSTLYQGLHTYVNRFGQVFQESPGTYLDGSSPVLMSFTTSWYNLAGLQGYERFYFLYLLGQYISPFKLNVQMAYDYNPSPRTNVIVAPDNQSPDWGGDNLWGSGAVWGGSTNVFQFRVFPSIQKTQAFQITVSEIYDPSFGIAAGEGLTLSGLNLVVGIKKGYKPIKATNSAG